MKEELMHVLDRPACYIIGRETKLSADELCEFMLAAEVKYGVGVAAAIIMGNAQVGSLYSQGHLYTRSRLGDADYATQSNYSFYNRKVYCAGAMSQTIIIPDHPDYINAMVCVDRVYENSRPKTRRLDLSL